MNTQQGSDTIPAEPQRLAEKMSRFVHGDEGLAEALKATETLAPGAHTRLDWKTVDAIVSYVPLLSLSYSEVVNSSLVDLSMTVGLLASKGAVCCLIKQGGLYMNNERVENEAKIIGADDIVGDKMLLLSARKKNKMVVGIT